MKLTTSEEDRLRYPDREWFRCEQCGMCAYKDASGAVFIPITHTRDAPTAPKTAITAPIEEARKPIRRSKRD